jgi:hypothetical protein
MHIFVKSRMLSALHEHVINQSVPSRQRFRGSRTTRALTGRYAWRACLANATGIVYNAWMRLPSTAM